MHPPAIQPTQFPEAAIGMNLRQRTKWFLLFSAGLTICFGVPLLDLLRFSLHSELYSHVLLVPAITSYLVWMDRHRLPLAFEPAPRLAVGLLLPGVALLAAYAWGLCSGWKPAGENDRLSLFVVAFLFFFTSGFAWFFGGRIMRAVAFPMAFLAFMAPLPKMAEDGLVNFLQLSSAETSYWFLTLSGMPVFRDGTVFNLPGITIGVAPECSGIRSTLVLFMTGLLAGHFFLRQPRFKITLALLLVPLGILRNAFRIFVLAQLAVHVNPDILNSDLHHRGGPIFFAVSLAPFFLLIWFLRKQETRSDKGTR